MTNKEKARIKKNMAKLGVEAVFSTPTKITIIYK